MYFSLLLPPPLLLSQLLKLQPLLLDQTRGTLDGSKITLDHAGPALPGDGHIHHWVTLVGQNWKGRGRAWVGHYESLSEMRSLCFTRIKFQLDRTDNENGTEGSE